LTKLQNTIARYRKRYVLYSLDIDTMILMVQELGIAIWV